MDPLGQRWGKRWMISGEWVKNSVRTWVGPSDCNIPQAKVDCEVVPDDGWVLCIPLCRCQLQQHHVANTLTIKCSLCELYLTFFFMAVWCVVTFSANVSTAGQWPQTHKLPFPAFLVLTLQQTLQPCLSTFDVIVRSYNRAITYIVLLDLTPL